MLRRTAFRFSSLAAIVAALASASALQAQQSTRETFLFRGDCTDCRQAYNAANPLATVNRYLVTGTLELEVEEFSDGSPTLARLLTFRYDPTNLLPYGVFVDARENTILEQQYDYAGGELNRVFFRWENGFFGLGGILGSPELAFDADEWALCVDEDANACLNVGPVLPGPVSDFGSDGAFLRQTTTVPEPASVVLLAAGLGALGIAARRRTTR
ncbi:MAG: VPLPA-CTERM sorting domain-containing protein [Gemmatimonadaceae bacterium]|nr:VPLPA-CTERM sorting domain-containing protein [Gemmatimonadaceae bacterium]